MPRLAIPGGLLFDAEIDVAIVEAQADEGRLHWRAAPQMYEYRLLDHEARELFVDHWQPGPDDLGPYHPHLHISASLSAQTSAVARQSSDLVRLHVATGCVSLASGVRTLITEFGIAPRRHGSAEVPDRSERIL